MQDSGAHPRSRELTDRSTTRRPRLSRLQARRATTTMKQQLTRLVTVTLAATLLPLLLLLSATSRTNAQTRSPTRRPTAPTLAPTPICAAYGQLPQVLNGTAQAGAQNGCGVALSADASILAVLSGSGGISVYTRPAGSPTSALFTKSNAIDLTVRLGAVPTACSPRVFSMSASGDTIAVGTKQSDNEFNASVTVLRATTRGFKTFNVSMLLQQDVDVPLGTSSADDPQFARAVSLSRSGAYLVVGVPQQTEESVSYNGMAVLYRLGGRGAKPWQFASEATIHSKVSEYGLLGSSVSVSDNGIVLASAAGVHNSGSLGDGVVFTFGRSIDGSYAQQGSAIRSLSGSGSFGSAVLIDAKGLTAVVANDEDDSVDHIRAGGVFIFRRASVFTTWPSLPQRLNPWGEENALVGASVAMSDDGNVVVAGAPGMYPDPSAVGKSSMWFRFDRNTTTGVWTTKGGCASPALFAISPSTVTYSTGLGSSIALSSDGGTVVVGSPNRSNAANDELVGGAEVWACGVAAS